MHAVGAEFINIYGFWLAMDGYVLLPEGEHRKHSFISDERGSGDYARGIVYGR